MKSKRELQFLTYLDALERGDAEGISAFLRLAEADAELEQMMLDHHQNENQEESPQVLSPLKRKREDVNRWWERFGMGLVATIAMILVGLAGVYIGASNTSTADALNQMLNPSQDPNALTTPNSPAAFDSLCQAEILSEDNTIQLLTGGDIAWDMRVGVNNPFLLLLSTNDRLTTTDYDAIFEGLRVIVDDESIRLHGRCDGLSSVQVLPKDDAYKTCDVRVDALQLPISNPNARIGTIKQSWLKNEAILISGPENGYYSVISPSFTGRIPIESVHPSAGCTSFPLFYMPSFSGPSNDYTISTTPTIQLDSLLVTEQRFEHGVFFYIYAVDQLWIVFDEEDGHDEWYVSGLDAINYPMYNYDNAYPANSFAPQAGLFESAWWLTGFGDRGPVRQIIGNAISEAQTYQAAYQSRLLASGYHTHSLTSTTGDVYALYENANRWQLNAGSNTLGTLISSTASPDRSCRAEIASADNTIQLLAEDDIDRTMTVGVNNPFVITLDTGLDAVAGYRGIFEGLRVSVARTSLNVEGNCANVDTIRVYPKDNPDKVCTIEGEPILFPIDYYFLDGSSMGKSPYDSALVLLVAPVDGAYPIIDNRFEGSVPAEYLRVSAGCTSFPLLYVQSSIPDPSNRENHLPTSIELSSLNISEQNFEHGAMFYLEALQQVWVACEPDAVSGYSTDSWIISRQETSVNPSVTLNMLVPGGLYSPQGALLPTWETVTNGLAGSSTCNLGWATNPITSYTSPYSMESSEGQIIHTLSDASGQRYSFHDTDSGENFWRLNEN